MKAVARSPDDMSGVNKRLDWLHDLQDVRHDQWKSTAAPGGIGGGRHIEIFGKEKLETCENYTPHST